MTIPNSVTSIGSEAFSGCSGLTSVTIPSSVTSIGEGAFYNCSGLTEVNYNATNCTSMGNSSYSPVFSRCTSLTTLNIGNNVKKIPRYAFYGCSSLTSVTIGNSVTSIGDYAFYDCRGLTSVTIPSSVTSIGEHAFYNCSSLTSVTIPDSLTSIGDYAFDGTAWYENQPDGVVYADKLAFKYKGTMPANTSISLQEGTLGIADRAFSGCSGLTSVTIPNSVTTIGSSAFEGCSGLTSVTIPNSVTSIGGSAFFGCSGLTSVTILDLAAWCSIIFSNSSSNPLNYAHHLYMNGEEVKDLIIPSTVTKISSCSFCDCSSLTSVTIPNSVTSIGRSAFRDCSGLTTVTIPNSVTSISESAFSGCFGLESMTVASGNSTYDSRANCNAIIETASNTLIAGCKNTIIPSSVTSIGDFAFYCCSSLTSVTIPNSVTSIGGYAFQGCSGLTSVTIGNSVTSIGIMAFCDCFGLTEVYCYAENVPMTVGPAFSPISTATLHVPAASLSSYQETKPWSYFGNIVGDIVLKCATPTIAFTNGKLSFECETEGVEYVYDISMTGSQSGRGNDIVLPGLPNTYAVSVYATKDGWVDSDVATKTLTFQAKTGDANGDGEISIADITTLINTILGNGNAAGSRAKVTENEEGR